MHFTQTDEFRYTEELTLFVLAHLTCLPKSSSERQIFQRVIVYLILKNAAPVFQRCACLPSGLHNE